MTNYAGLEPLREDVAALVNDIYELLSRLKTLESARAPRCQNGRGAARPQCDLPHPGPVHGGVPRSACPGRLL